MPANKTYVVAIESAGSYFAYNRSTKVRICTSARPSTTAFDPDAASPVGCVNQPTGVSVVSNQMVASATNGVRELAGGTSGTSWVISTAIRPDDYLDWYNGFNNTVVHTLVTVAQKN